MLVFSATLTICLHSAESMPFAPVFVNPEQAGAGQSQ
jgi:hypothetical protein